MEALRTVLLGLTVLTVPSSGRAGGGGRGDAPGWELDCTLTGYLLPDAADYLQPTVTADRGALHLEGRYAYEDRESSSAFAGWSFALGDALSLTPMVGMVVGRTDAVAPALELAFTWGPVELRSESEWVLPLDGGQDGFFYSWSELTAAVAAGWLRVGAVGQRTRTFRAPSEVSIGPMATFSAGPVEASVYLLEPWDRARFAAVSISVALAT